MGHFGDGLGFTLKVLWDLFVGMYGTTLGVVWGHFDSPLGSLWGYPEVTKRELWGAFKGTPNYFEGTLRLVLRHYQSPWGSLLGFQGYIKGT